MATAAQTPRQVDLPLRRLAGLGRCSLHLGSVSALSRRSGQATVCHGCMALQKTRGGRMPFSGGKAVIRREATATFRVARRPLIVKTGQASPISPLGRGVLPAGERESLVSRGRLRFLTSRLRSNASTVITRLMTRCRRKGRLATVHKGASLWSPHRREAREGRSG